MRLTKAISAALLALAALQTAAGADIVIEVIPGDGQGNVISTTVAAGTTVFVDFRAAVTPPHVPLLNVRGIEFDFTQTSSSIQVVSFQWMLAPPAGDSLYLKFTSLPKPGAAYIQTARMDGFILDFTEALVPIARVQVVVQASGVLNAGTGPAFANGGGLWITSGFGPILNFDTANGNLVGGLIEFVVPGTQPPDDNDNGTPPGNGNDNEPVGNTNDNRNTGNDNTPSNDNTGPGNDNTGPGNDNAALGNENGTSGSNDNDEVPDNANDNGSGPVANDNTGANDNVAPGANENDNDGPPDNANDNDSGPVGNDNIGANDNQAPGGNQNDNNGLPDNTNANGSGGGRPRGVCGLGLLGPSWLALTALCGAWIRRRWVR